MTTTAISATGTAAQNTQSAPTSITWNRRNVSIVVGATALTITCVALALLTKGASLALILPILRGAYKMIQDPSLSLYDVFLYAVFNYTPPVTENLDDARVTSNGVKEKTIIAVRKLTTEPSSLEDAKFDLSKDLNRSTIYRSTTFGTRGTISLSPDDLPLLPGHITIKDSDRGKIVNMIINHLENAGLSPEEIVRVINMMHQGALAPILEVLNVRETTILQNRNASPAEYSAASDKMAFDQGTYSVIMNNGERELKGCSKGIRFSLDIMTNTLTGKLLIDRTVDSAGIPTHFPTNDPNFPAFTYYEIVLHYDSNKIEIKELNPRLWDLESGRIANMTPLFSTEEIERFSPINSSTDASISTASSSKSPKLSVVMADSDDDDHESLSDDSGPDLDNLGVAVGIPNSAFNLPANDNELESSGKVSKSSSSEQPTLTVQRSAPGLRVII